MRHFRIVYKTKPLVVEAVLRFGLDNNYDINT